MEIDYHKEAFVIAGELTNGKIQYYTYDYDNRCYGWTFCVFDANFYSSSEEVSVFMRNIVSDKDIYQNIKKIWVEKLASVKCDKFSQVVLRN